ncbi:hypothetical protein [Actinomadura gamaensis]|uniref:Uncharacterized protein n=1 Tax=Actinomadura gamaensis TaxID=1763541 RepID=A0ABV9U133_9ACTN
MGDERGVPYDATTEPEAAWRSLGGEFGPSGTAVAMGQAVICRLYAVGLDLAALRTPTDGTADAAHLEHALAELDDSIAEIRRLLYRTRWDEAARSRRN